MGFRSLQHIQESKVHRFVGFSLPTAFRLQGLGTLLTAFSLRSRAGSVSHRRRSWDSPLRSLTVPQVSSRFRLKGPTCRFTCRCSHRRSVGPARQVTTSGLFPYGGFLPAPGGVSTWCQRKLPWGFPFQGVSRRPWPGFRPASSHTLRPPSRKRPGRPASQSLDRPSLGCVSTHAVSRISETTSPPRVSAPAES